MGKMARLLLVAALCLASVKAAVIPVEEIVDNLQSFLTAPEESGLRLKRSTGEWDKEFDLSSMGILFQLKYNNPANPFEGGRAHVKVPGARFIRNAPFDDMDLDIEFNGGSAIDGLFDMKVDYKFIQKFMFLADRPQEGSFVLYRKMEGGMWKTKVTVDNNNMMPKPFLDISVKSDRKTKLHVLFNFQEDNKWELMVDRVPGQKMTIEVTVNGKKWTGVGNLNQGEMKLNLKMDPEFTGKHYTLDFDLNPSGMWGIHITGDVDGPVDAKWTMQKDYTMGEIVVKYKNQNYAFMQLKGNAEMRGVFPVVFDYVVKYNIKDAMEHQGKAKMKFDGKTPAKKFEMSFAPKTGTPMDLIWNMDFSFGFKYDYDFKMNAVTMEKGNGEYKWVNNGQKFELMTKDTFIVTKQSPFHWMNTMVTGGREWTKMEHTRNIFFDKVNKAQMINKMKIEEHNILDGQTWYHIKYDNTAPETAFLFTYLPYNMDQAWTYEGGREHTANGGSTLTHKITHGENVIQEAEWVFDVKVNDGSKFEMEHLHKMTMTEESPFYGMVYWYTGRYGKNVERKMTVFFDKINKSILFVPKMKMDTTLTLDGEKISEFVFGKTQAKKHIKFFYSPDAYTKDYLYEEEWEYPGFSGIKCKIDFKRGGASTYNYDGEYSWVNNANKFEVKSNEKANQEANGPYYGMDYWLVGTYWKSAVVTRTFTYEKKNRNFLLGKIHFESKVMADGERFYEAKLDTRATPYPMVWFHKPVRALYPTPRDLTGQDGMTVTAWHTPGKELKIETNLPEVQSMKVTSAGATKKFEFNGKEVATVDFDSSSKKASHTMHLPSGKDLTIDLAWPKMTPAASDLEFGVTIAPDRKVGTKFGWEMAGVKKVYLDVVGNNPWMGDYKLSRQGEFEEVSGSVYKIKWTGHGETTKGFLRRVSPVETNVVASVNVRNMKVDAIVRKSFAGQKYGFTLNNDKFTLLAGKH